MSSFTRGKANVDDLLTSTLDNYRNELTEQWVTAHPITKKMFDKNSDLLDGGNDIVEHVEYQANATSGFISKTGTVDVTINQIMTDVRFTWSWIAGSVGLQDHESVQNMGKSAFFNLLEKRVKNLTNSMRIDIDAALAAASQTDANYPFTLQEVIDSGNPTLANYGDVDRTVDSWWQATETASGSMQTQGLEDIRTAYLSTSRDLTDPVTFMLAPSALYLAYNNRLTVSEQLVRGDKGDLEFEHLAFHGKPVFPASSLTSTVWLGINSNYTRIKINKNCNMKNRPFVRALGGQSESAVVQTQMQLVCTRPASNFKLTGMSA